MLQNEDDVKALIQVAWNYYVLDIYVVSRTAGIVYTYFPFKDGHCNDTNPVVENCKDNLEFFPEKILLKMNGCTVNIGALNHAPYIVNPNLSSDNPMEVGLESLILNRVLSHLNLSASYVENNYGHWGYRYPDGSSTFLYKLIFDRKCDIMIGHNARNDSFTYQLDSSNVYIFDKFRWFVPLALPIQRWKNLVFVFEPLLWLSLLLAFIGTVVIWSWISDREVSLSFLKLWYVMLQGSVSGPKKQALGVLYICWTLVTLLLATAYQSKLVSMLMQPVYENQISTPQQLLDSNLPFGSLPSARNIFATNNTEDQQIYARFIDCPVPEDCIDLIFVGKFAFMMSEMTMDYRTPNYMKLSNTTNGVYGFRQVVKEGPYSMYTVKGFPFLLTFDRLLLLLAQNGLLAKWTKEALVNRLSEDFELQPLALTHLASIFLSIMIGHAASTLVFVIEILYNSFHSKH